LTISWYQKLSSENAKLFTYLDQDIPNSQPGWRCLCDSLVKDKKVALKKNDVTCLSEKCFYKLGDNLIEIMKSKRVKINSLESVIKEKLPHREDILDCLNHLQSANYHTFDSSMNLDDVENLKVCIGNRSLQAEKNDWMTICDGLELEKTSTIELKRKCIELPQEEYSPSESLFKLLYARKPDLHMIEIYRALRKIKRLDLSRVLMDIIAINLKSKLEKLINSH